MDRALDSLIRRVLEEHDCHVGATSDELADAEARLGFSFPEDLRKLLRETNGIKFWKDGEFPCRFLSAGEIKPVHLILETDEGPRGLVAIIQIESNVVGIGLDPDSKCYLRIVDCSHETFPHELFGVCNSLREMLELILGSKGDEWTWPAVMASRVDYADGGWVWPVS